MLTGLDPQGRVILLLSRVLPVKSMELVIDAMPDILQRNPNAK